MNKEKLQRALALLGPKGENWIQGAYGLDADGDTCSSFYSEAVKFCMVGACFHAGIYPVPEFASSLFNDQPTTTFREVKQLFEQAIAACKD